LDVKAYLERIKYRGSVALTAATLRDLQVAHLLTVPFENLSIHAHEPIVLSDDALFAKIVKRRRGGFCYECNGLFAALLRALGFEISMLSAEVAHPDGGYSQPFDHMTLLVDLQQRWLVDVGFGDSFLEPLLLDDPGEQIQGNRAYRIVRDGDYFIPSRRDDGDGRRVDGDGPRVDGGWRPQYRFTLHPYEYEDYAAMCAYHQTSPQSHFTQGRICSRATEDGGRISLSEMRLITTSENGERQESVLESDAEYAAALREHFGIEMESGGK